MWEKLDVLRAEVRYLTERYMVAIPSIITSIVQISPPYEPRSFVFSENEEEVPIDGTKRVHRVDL